MRYKLLQHGHFHSLPCCAQHAASELLQAF